MRRRARAARARRPDDADSRPRRAGRSFGLDGSAHRLDDVVVDRAIEASCRSAGLAAPARRGVGADAGHGDAGLRDRCRPTASAWRRPRRARNRRCGAPPPRTPSRCSRGSFGSTISVTISSSARSTVSASRKKSRAATVRVPAAEAIVQLGIEQQRHHRQLGGRVGMRQAAADRAAVADREMRDVPHRFGSTGNCRAISGEVSSW